MIVNLEKYLAKKKNQMEETIQPRKVCETCMQPLVLCFCAHIQKISLDFTFVVLNHPIEARRKAATGRMAHLCLPNSHLIRGHDFSNNKTINHLLDDPTAHPVVLYPGPQSANLTEMTEAERQALTPLGKRLMIFVLDGTWATAKKMIKHSKNLNPLPRICFTPDKPSNFHVRKQPHAGCYSTIEAIHHTIELLGSSHNFNTATRAHDQLLRVFDSMVTVHLGFLEKYEEKPSRYAAAYNKSYSK